MSSIQKAVALAGGQIALARKICAWHAARGAECRVRQQHVWKWLNEQKTPKPPAEHCRAIADITGISVYELRPDVFGNAPVMHAQTHDSIAR